MKRELKPGVNALQATAYFRNRSDPDEEGTETEKSIQWKRSSMRCAPDCDPYKIGVNFFYFGRNPSLTIFERARIGDNKEAGESLIAPHYNLLTAMK